MKISTKDLGDHRWILRIETSNYNEATEFLQWIGRYKDQVWCKEINSIWRYGNRIFEVRSRNPVLKTLITLKWLG